MSGYESWREQDWLDLVHRCREDGVLVPTQHILRAATSYMERGADGGGNDLGLVGTIVALNVDKVQQERQS